MKFTADTKTLQAHLATLAPAINKSSVLAMLENVLLEVAGTTLTLTGTDLDIRICTQMTVQDAADGSVCVNYRMLSDYIKALPQQPVTISLDGNAMLFSTANGKYRIGTEAAADYPKTPQSELTELPLDGQAFAGTLAKLTHLCSNDELRPAMMGVLVEVGGGKVSMCATDAHSLGWEVQKDDRLTGDVRRYIVRRKSAALFARLIAENKRATIRVSDNFMQVEAANVTAWGRLEDANFPDYNAVIPKDQTGEGNVDKLAIIGALQRVVLFTNRTTNQVVLDLQNDKVVLSGVDADFANEGEETVPARFKTPLRIAFNAMKLTEILRLCEGEEVHFAYSTNTRAMIISDESDTQYLLMPLMVS